VLAAHRWWVMKPHIDANSRVMARIDVHQPIETSCHKNVAASAKRAISSPKDSILTNLPVKITQL
jgi:hypothetical protein